MLYLSQIDFPDERGTELGHRLGKRETVFADNNVTQSFVWSPVFVGSRRGGSKPALIDATPVESKSVEVIGMQFEAFTGLQKGTRHPAGSQTQKPASLGESAFDERLNVTSNGCERSDCIHEWFL